MDSIAIEAADAKVVGLVTLLVTMLVWIAYFRAVGKLNLDRFRDGVFVLRDELFDMASRGELSFDCDAYKHLRGALNGSLRSGHRLALVPMVAALAKRNALRRKYGDWPSPLSDRWRVATAHLRPEVVEKLERIRDRLHVMMILYTMASSPVGMPILVGTQLAKGLRRLVWRLLSRAAQWPVVRATLDDRESEAARAAAGRTVCAS